jgi:hypothetical protein
MKEGHASISALDWVMLGRCKVQFRSCDIMVFDGSSTAAEMFSIHPNDSKHYALLDIVIDVKLRKSARPLIHITTPPRDICCDFTRAFE